LAHDPVEQLLAVREELARRRAEARIFEDRGVLPLQLPHVEEERPVDGGDERLERLPVDAAQAEERGASEVLGPPLDGRPSRTRPCSTRFCAFKSLRRSGSRSAETTPTTREASRTCSVGPPA